ncbi:EcsC family protein [Peribacillus glennii]|uniref:EcsC family protein n=1 Tax=Peribacillus glennii TaxID=2303991 RepID=A0A372LI84_9BACI|nr:EcsC family protein [Peribacillus glennii]RFU66000.1 EcsC family protein [Peribacillus glennii]
MGLTDREQQVWNQISEWEQNLLQYEPNDFAALYGRWLEQGFSMLPEGVQRRFFEKLDSSLFHLHAMVQSSQIQMDARERILATGRMFHPDIASVSDLKALKIDQLNYIAGQHIAKHRLYSFAQGGASGSGGMLMLGSDLPAMAIINVRAVQLIAMSYGYEVDSPFEMMMALKVFDIGMMPKRLQGAAWEELLHETKNAEDGYFYEGNDELTNISWLEQPLSQILKVMAITAFRKKLIQGIPLVSMAIGAGTNYQTTRKVSEFAQKYYQYRYLDEKREEQK